MLADDLSLSKSQGSMKSNVHPKDSFLLCLTKMS